MESADAENYKAKNYVYNEDCSHLLCFTGN